MNSVKINSDGLLMRLKYLSKLVVMILRSANS